MPRKRRTQKGLDTTVRAARKRRVEIENEYVRSREEEAIESLVRVGIETTEHFLALHAHGESAER